MAIVDSGKDSGRGAYNQEIRIGDWAAIPSGPLEDGSRSFSAKISKNMLQVRSSVLLRLKLLVLATL